ncbi:MAG TPA: hypothetical protein VMV32_09055 [Ignavibacteriaceae bacterium]|nr:hypothetical protein [Ignavibacteriaceae bacterium]
MVQKKIIGLLGIWLTLSTFIFHTADGNLLNFLLVGILSAISGLTLTVKKTVKGWISGSIGLWLIISAFIPFIAKIPWRYINSTIIGVLFILIGIVNFEKEIDLTKPYKYDSKIHTNRY